MDDIALTQLFVEYAKASKLLEALKYQIEKEILSRGESLRIAGIEAKYYQPSAGTPDYEGAGQKYLSENNIPTEEIAQFQTIKITTRYKELCEHFNIQAPPGEEKPARVVIK